MMDSSKVTVKGQILIPVGIRQKVGIRKGTRVFLEEKNGDIIVHPATSEFYDRHFGILKGSGLTKALLEERRKEKEHEETKFGKR
jgi:AbrB family looped-hinge helix DNA binding protein